MKYLFYYTWVGLAFLHPWISRILTPFNMVIIKIGKKSRKDQNAWRRNYNKAILEFPGGINDWIAFAFFLAFIFGPILTLLIYFDMEVGLFKSKIRLYVLFIGITAFCYYWLYFKNIDWLKERINKVSKKYYIK